MNFRKIIWIFFVAFIILDVFLVYSYVQQNDLVDSTTNTVTTNSVSSIMKSIHNDQITTDKLSSDTKQGYYVASSNDTKLRDKAAQLKYSDWTYSNHKLSVTFATLIKVSNKNPQKVINSLLKDSSQVIYGKDYRYLRTLSSGSQVVYAQQVYRMPVYSSAGQIKFIIKNGYITSYTQSYLSNVQALREKKTIISQQRALIWLYQYNKIPSSSTVEWSALGYTKLLSVNNSTIYIPTWNFYIRNNSAESYYYRRINAFTGAVMEDQ